MSSPESKPAPSRLVRLAWWIGIYLTGPPIAFLTIQENYFPRNAGEAVWQFPCGLNYFFASLLALLSPRAANSIIVSISVWAPGYALYLVHAIISLWVRTRRAFIIMIILLVILVALNLTGCAIASRDPEMSRMWNG